MAKGGRFTYIEYQGEDAARVLASMITGQQQGQPQQTPTAPPERAKAGFVAHVPDLDIDTDTDTPDEEVTGGATDPD